MHPLDSLQDCYDALMDLRKKHMRGDLSLDDFWCEAEVIVDRARGIQQDV